MAKPFNELSPEEQAARIARAAKMEDVSREKHEKVKQDDEKVGHDKVGHGYGHEEETHDDDGHEEQTKENDVNEKAEAKETLARAGDSAGSTPEIPRAGLDADTVSRIRREAREYVDEQLRERGLASKKDQEAKLRDDLIHQFRKDAGLTDHLDDLIEYTPNLPPYADRFVIDGVEYHHGYTATMRRSLFDHLRWVEAAGWSGEDAAGNPNRKYYRRPEAITGALRNMRFHEQGWAIARETKLSALGGAVVNPPLNNAMVGGLSPRGR